MGYFDEVSVILLAREQQRIPEVGGVRLEALSDDGKPFQGIHLNEPDMDVGVHEGDMRTVRFALHEEGRFLVAHIRAGVNERLPSQEGQNICYHPDSSEPGNHLSDHGLKVLVRTFNREIGIFLIEWGPLVVHCPQALAGEKDDAPCRDVSDPPFHLHVRDLQVHHQPQGFQVRHCRPAAYHAPASRYYRFLGTKGEDCILLALHEGVGPILVNDLLEPPAGLLLDKDVRIDELQKKRLCEDDADRALPCAWHPDENDVPLVNHDDPGIRPVSGASPGT